MVDDATVRAARAARAEDLPGRPIAWGAALDALLATVAGVREAAGVR